MKNLISIGEMAKLNNLTIQRLRYYDNIGLFSPVYIDETTKYRYYEKEQSRHLEKIQSLQYIGFTLNEIKMLLQENEQDFKKMLNDKMLILDEKEKKIKRKKQILNNYKHGLLDETMENEIHLGTYEAFTMLNIPSSITDFLHVNDDEYLTQLQDIKLTIDKYKLSRGFIPYIYLPTASTNKQSLIFKTSDHLNQKERKEIPESMYYYMYTTYLNMNKAIKALAKKASDQGCDFFIEPLSELKNPMKSKFIIYHRLKQKKE